MTVNSAKLPAAQIAVALRSHYTPPKPGGVTVEGEKLIELLQTLPSLSAEDHVDTILVQIQRHHPGISLNRDDHAMLSFVDDSVTHILRQTDLDFKIESFIRDLAPFTAIIALQEGIQVLSRPQPVLTLMESLIRECIGWSEDLGILGEQFMAKVEESLRPMIGGRTDVETCLQELRTFFAKEAQIHKTMEERLCDSQLKVLAGQKARFYATDLLNKQMAGKPLPLFMIFMLQGSWYEFLQQVFVHHGHKSDQWKQAEELTASLIWSLQVQNDKAKQESVMAVLPDKIRTFCSGLEFDTDHFVESLADVESEYEAIRTGNPSDPCDFELMEVDSSMNDETREIDPKTREQIEKFDTSQWFLYKDPESDERIARIKLILNWADTERMLFTNHNRRKTLIMSWGELAENLSAGIVRTLTPKNHAHEIIKAHLTRVIQSVSQQKRKEKQVPETGDRQVITEQYFSKRRVALEQALEKHKKLAAAKETRAKVLRQKAQQKLEAANTAVAALRQEAWVKLPIMEGTLTPCKLVAIIPASNKYIFANRAGIKVAEYTGSQLAHMIVTENSEILDTGAEFEGVLASVVSGLREDRNKSYDELTGDMA